MLTGIIFLAEIVCAACLQQSHRTYVCSNSSPSGFVNCDHLFCLICCLLSGCRWVVGLAAHWDDCWLLSTHKCMSDALFSATQREGIIVLSLVIISFSSFLWAQMRNCCTTGVCHISCKLCDTVLTFRIWVIVKSSFWLAALHIPQIIVNSIR